MINGKKIGLRSLALILALTASGVLSCTGAFADDSTFECGRNLFKSKMYKDALRYFKAAQSESSYDSRSYYYEALCYHQMGQLQGALAAYTNVINKFPESDAAEQSKKAVASMGKSYSTAKSGSGVSSLSNLRMDQIPLVATISTIKPAEANGKPVVEALVSGAKVKFVVDASVPDTVIGADVAKESKLPDGAALAKSDKDSFYFLHEIKLGTMSRVSFPVKVSNKDPKVAILGADFFASTNQAFDPKTGVLTVKRAAGFSNPFEAGLNYFNKKRYREAYPLLRKASVDRPRDPRALYTLAVCAHRLNKIDEARGYYRQVLQRFNGSEAETYATAALMNIDPGFAQKTRVAAATKSNQLLGPALKKQNNEFEVPYTAENGNFKVSVLVDGQNVEMYFVANVAEHVFSSEQLRRIDPSYVDNLPETAGATEMIEPNNPNNLSRLVTHQVKIKRIRFGKIDAINTTAKVIDSVTRLNGTFSTSERPILAGMEVCRNYRVDVIQNRRVLHFVQLVQ